MTSKENEIINNRTGKEKRWQWSDEIEDSKKNPEKKPELESDNHTFTSVAKLLDAERDIELKRPGEYFKKSSNKKNSKDQ